MHLDMVWRACLAFVAIGALRVQAIDAEPLPNFYAGKTLTIIVSAPAGGGYDALARAVADHLPNHLPGAPAVVVQNMPGAAGIVAMNYLYSSAAKDGTIIGTVQNDTPFAPLFGAKEAKYDATKFNWLGTPNTEVDILSVWHTVPVDTIDDLKKRELIIGSTGANSNPGIWAKILTETLGLKLKTIVGYPGQKEILLGMERGEVDGTFIFYNSLMESKPNWVEDKIAKILLQIGEEKEPKIAEVPLAEDLATKPEDKLLIEEAAAPLAIGRPYVMPPGVPADRVALMREAITETFKDPAFVVEIRKMKMEANAIRTGAQIQETIARAYATPPQVTDRVRKILNP
jgi:tripartite-type tricarboxylate transporter receptor subunit TctC